MFLKEHISCNTAHIILKSLSGKSALLAPDFQSCVTLNSDLKGLKVSCHEGMSYSRDISPVIRNFGAGQ